MVLVKTKLSHYYIVGAYRWCSINLINDKTVWFRGVRENCLHLCCCFDPLLEDVRTPIITSVHLDHIIASVGGYHMSQRGLTQPWGTTQQGQL